MPIYFGLDLIHLIQQFRTPFLDEMFKFISTLGTLNFFLLVLPFFFFVLNARFTAQVAVTVISSSYICAVLKDWIGAPRPFELDAAVAVIKTVGSSMPSGHAQNSLIFWFMVGSYFKNPWTKAFGVLMVLLVGLSRVYLGVHFPADVLMGWLIGAFVMLVAFKKADAIEKWGAGLPFSARLVISITLPMALYAIHPEKYLMPALGSFMGFGVGFTLLHKRDFKGFVFGAFSDRFFRYSIGLIGGLFFFYGVKSVSIDVLGAKGSLEIVIDFLRYFLLVFWVVYGVPHLFRHKHPLKTYSSSPELSQT